MAIVPPTPTKTWTGEDVDDLDRRVRAVEQRLEAGAVPGGELVKRVAALEFERKLLTGVLRASVPACCPMGVGGQVTIFLPRPWGSIEIHALEVVPLDNDADPRDRKLLTIVGARAGRFEHTNHCRGDVIFPILVTPGIEALITIENLALKTMEISLVYRYLDIEVMKRAEIHG